MPTIWMDFMAHFWTNGTALFLTKKHGTNSKLSFDQKFQMQVISCIIKLNNRNHEWKNETQIPRTKTLYLSHLDGYMYRWVARSLLTMATRIEQLSHHKIMVLDLQCFITWTVHLGHCSLPGISLALVVVDKWYWNFSSARMNHSIWVLPRITGFSIQMVSTPVVLSIYSTKTFKILEIASKKILEIPGAKLNGKKTSG